MFANYETNNFEGEDQAPMQDSALPTDFEIWFLGNQGKLPATISMSREVEWNPS
jgi:hypothetical protein